MNDDIAANYWCQYCGKPFILEHHYLNHRCKQMKIEDYMQTVDGQASYMYYCDWLKIQGRMPPRRVEAFTTSKFYTSFVKFTEWSKKIKLPDPNRYMKLMCEKNAPPSIWTSTDMYLMYMDYLDNKVGPIDQAKRSIDTLIKISNGANIEISDIFQRMPINDVILLLQTRRISPWLLLCSSKFKSIYRTMTTDQHIIFENLINPSRWAEFMKKHQSEIIEIKQMLGQYGL